MWVSLVFKNIKTFMKTKTVLFLFIVVSQIICIIAAFAVAGMVDAVTPEPEDERSDTQKMFFISFTPNNESNPYTDFFELFDEKEKKFIYIGTDENEVNKIREKLREIADEDITNVHTIDTNHSQKYINIDNLHNFKEIKSKMNEIIQTGMNDLLYYEMYGYTDDTQDTSFLAIGGDDEWLKKYRSEIYGNNNKISVTKSPYIDSPYTNLKEGDKITIGSTEYTVSEVKDKTNMPPDSQTSLRFMYNSIDDSFKVNTIHLRVKDTTEQKDIAKIQKKIDEVFRDDMPEVEQPEPKPLLEKQFNNMIYVLSFIMIAVVILNISRLYTFIMSTRKKSLAVFSICGASKFTIFAMYISEIFITLLASFIMGFLIFRFGLIGIISSIYPSFLEFFTFKIYLMIFGIYMTVGLIVMTANIIPVVRKSVTDLKKG